MGCALSPRSSVSLPPSSCCQLYLAHSEADRWVAQWRTGGLASQSIYLVTLVALWLDFFISKMGRSWLDCSNESVIRFVCSSRVTEWNEFAFKGLTLNLCAFAVWWSPMRRTTSQPESVCALQRALSGLTGDISAHLRCLRLLNLRSRVVVLLLMLTLASIDLLSYLPSGLVGERAPHGDVSASLPQSRFCSCSCPARAEFSIRSRLSGRAAHTHTHN